MYSSCVPRHSPRATCLEDIDLDQPWAVRLQPSWTVRKERSDASFTGSTCDRSDEELTFFSENDAKVLREPSQELSGMSRVESCTQMPGWLPDISPDDEGRRLHLPWVRASCHGGGAPGRRCIGMTPRAPAAERAHVEQGHRSTAQGGAAESRLCHEELLEDSLVIVLDDWVACVISI